MFVICVLWDECLFAEEIIFSVIFDKLLEEFAILEIGANSGEVSSVTQKRNAQVSDVEMREFSNQL
jgi:hypothetical protein